MYGKIGGCSIDNIEDGSSKKRIQGDSGSKIKKCRKGTQGARN